MSTLDCQIPLPARVRVPLLLANFRASEWLSDAATARDSARAVADLCEEARRAFGVQHVLPVDRASSALLIGLRALGLGEGDEVIIQSLMCRSPAQAIVQAGCRPVLVDVGQDYNIDPGCIEKAITSRTRAVMIANMFGRVAAVEEIQDLARRHGLFFIDDAALSAGAQHGDRMSGALGDFGIVSFNQGKNLVAGGGGLLLTDNEELFGRVKKVELNKTPRGAFIKRWLSFLVRQRLRRAVAPAAAAWRLARRQRPVSLPVFYRTYAHPRLDPAPIHPLQASMACRQLRRLGEIVERCRSNAERLSLMLQHIPGLVLPELGGHTVHSLYPVQIEAGSRWELGMHLRQRGIETKWSYYPLHLHDRFAEFGGGDMPNSENIWKRLLYLPADAALSAEQVNTVGRETRSFFEAD